VLPAIQSCYLLFAICCCAPKALPPFFFQLDTVRLDDGGDQTGKPLLDFIAARSVTHFDSVPFASNQARFPKRLEML
jgi:hypothetical protein